MNTFQKKEIQNMVVFFPEDVTIDILLRLPLKSLGRSRCVSKYWNTLITSPSFIKAHLHRASKLCHLICQESKHTELMMHHLGRGGGCHHMSEEDDEEELSISKLKIRFSGSCEFSNLDPHPTIIDGFNNFNLVDSFNGIVCLYAVNEKASTSRIWLWNPAINDCFVVPEPRFPISSAKSHCVGFGFNPLTSHLGDFKVVSITLYYKGFRPDEKRSSRAEIYSRRTNSWKELVGWFPNPNNIGKKQVIFEEYICWSSYDRRWSGDQYNVIKTIVSFNLVSEEFHAMALPDSIPFGNKGCITLLDGCVSLLAPYSGGYEVWTMKEFGNIESWNKLYYLDFQSSRFLGRSICIPLGFASSDEALFLKWHSYGLRHASNKVIHSYDTRTMTLDESKTVSFDRTVKNCCLKLYVESLISVSYISRLDEGQSSDE